VLIHGDNVQRYLESNRIPSNHITQRLNQLTCDDERKRQCEAEWQKMQHKHEYQSQSQRRRDSLRRCASPDPKPGPIAQFTNQ
jgi:hypothetical protein